ncbi:YdcF family protein [Methylophaga pinxianii]|uniref:YdcF family protein n=1 Tax=Methylophaga pinxianii TaxID=2881052 RepID=UPI001CF59903|nr:YdcF family protein [Methylophaga pinxianii]MCB2428297.1 YdcF family protein [Methylophaga pinxianii]UPH45235.1 YdcF family protein [Methylophaga pinxianii]
MEQLFFVLSKLAWAILSPLMVLNLLLVLGTVFLLFGYRKVALRFLFPALLFSLSLIIFPLGDWLIYPLEARISQPEQLPENIDGIIVLGGGEDIKTTISWQQPQVGQASDRYFGAALLAKQYPDSPIIFTGGNNLLRFDAGTTPAELSHELLTMVGVEEKRLIIESQSRNTYENFQRLKTVIPKRNGQYLLVTSAYHMPRSVGIAEKQGISVVPYPVDYRSQTGESRQMDFALFEQFEKLEPAWREWVGLTAYFITGKTSQWFPDIPTKRLVETTTDSQADIR